MDGFRFHNLNNLTRVKSAPEMPDFSPTYRNLLRLLRFGLYEMHDRKCSLGASLSERQWYKLLEEAEKQTVTGIIFPAISCLPESEMPSVSVLATWLAMSNRDSRRYHKMSYVISRLSGLFEGNGLHPVLQKGHAASRFYSHPELRACGDIDLWFPDDERGKADAIVKRLGHRVVHTPDNGSCYVADSMEVEHHSMLIEVHNPFHAGFMRELYRTYPSHRVEIAPAISIDVPSPMVELLMMNVHILKHCLGVGIGMRQFCDYAMAWRCLVESDGRAVDIDEYLDLCRRLGIIRWTRVLHRFVNRYMPAFDGDAVTDMGGDADDMTVDRIYYLVCEGGNFGKFSHKYRAAHRKNMVRRKVQTMYSFINNRSFVSRLVPFEAFWTFSRLLLGQIH